MSSAALSKFYWFEALGASTADGVIAPQNYDRTDHGDDQAVDIEPGDTGSTEGAEDHTTDNRSDYAEHDIHQEALTTLINDFAADEAGDDTEDNPADDSHCAAPFAPRQAEISIARAKAQARLEIVVERVNCQRGPD